MYFNWIKDVPWEIVIQIFVWIYFWRGKKNLNLRRSDNCNMCISNLMTWTQSQQLGDDYGEQVSRVKWDNMEQRSRAGVEGLMLQFNLKGRVLRFVSSVRHIRGNVLKGESTGTKRENLKSGVRSKLSKTHGEITSKLADFILHTETCLWSWCCASPL